MDKHLVSETQSSSDPVDSRHQMTPSGSRFSPIPIEDSEEEVLVELVEGPTASSSSMTLDTPTWAPKGNEESPPFDIDFAPDQPQKRSSLKRKQNLLDAGLSVGEALSDRLSSPHPGESRSARKKRRKLERLAKEAERSVPAPPPIPPPPLPPPITAPPPQQLKPIPNRPRNVRPRYPQTVPPQSSVPNSIPVAPRNAPVAPRNDPLPGQYSYPFLHQPAFQQFSYGDGYYDPSMGFIPQYSDWFAAMPSMAEMAHVGSSSLSLSNMTILPPLSVTFPTGPGTSSELLDMDPPQLSLPPPAAPTSTLPKPPQSPPQPIGVRSEQGVGKNHGRFTIPPVPLIWCKSSQAQKDGKYFLNASCSLVMEQLPKTHRTIDFVRSWAKTASDSDPAYISIDSSKGKALVEFSDVASAQAAWGSPRLGSELATFKPIQLKGRPRVDLIRVWWYRPNATDVDSAELEEGEIANDEVVLIEEKSQVKAASNPSAPKRIPKEPRAHPKPPLNAPTAPRNHSIMRESSYPTRTISSGSTPIHDRSTLPSPSTTLNNSLPEVNSIASLTPPITPVLSSFKPVPPRGTRVIAAPKLWINLPDAPTPSDSTLSPTQSVMDVKPPTPSSDLLRLSNSQLSHDIIMHPQASTPSPIESLPAPLPVPPEFKPKAASMHTKEYLQARQKELEARILRSKMELQSMQAKTSQPKASSPTSSTQDTTVVSTVLEKESKLRELVVRSQRKKIITSMESMVSTPTPDNAMSPPSTIFSPVTTSAISATTAFSLEDLAISFISETIETVKLNQKAAPPPASKPTPAATVKEELALKQRRLEEHIIESKVLMAQLTQVRNKEEKTYILTTLREKTRMMEEANKASDVRIEIAKAEQLRPPSSANPVARWPSFCQNTSVFDISDESDGDD